jgi:hypothetical protein
MDRSRSLKVLISQNIDSGTDWVRAPTKRARAAVGARSGTAARGAGPRARAAPVRQARRAPARGPARLPRPRSPHPPFSRPQESRVSRALGPRYWLVASQHMFQTRLSVFARVDVVPFIRS